MDKTNETIDKIIPEEVRKFGWHLGDPGQQIGDGWPDARLEDGMARGRGLTKRAPMGRGPAPARRVRKGNPGAVKRGPAPGGLGSTKERSTWARALPKGTIPRSPMGPSRGFRRPGGGRTDPPITGPVTGRRLPRPPGRDIPTGPFRPLPDQTARRARHVATPPRAAGRSAANTRASRRVGPENRGIGLGRKYRA